jgi:hypothetical protein
VSMSIGVAATDLSRGWCFTEVQVGFATGFDVNQFHRHGWTWSTSNCMIQIYLYIVVCWNDCQRKEERGIPKKTLLPSKYWLKAAYEIRRRKKDSCMITRAAIYQSAFCGISANSAQSICTKINGAGSSFLYPKDKTDQKVPSISWPPLLFMFDKLLLPFHYLTNFVLC